MASTVTTRPSHYETLGVTPTASGDEIAQAFARQISSFQPRAFGGIAEVSVAYEVLRDPVRRRNYDESIGLKPEPKAPPPTNIAFTLHREWSPGGFIIAPQDVPEAETMAETPAAGEASAAAVPEVAVTEPIIEPEPEPEAVPEPQRAPAPEREIEEMLLRQSREAEPVSFNWRRPALIVGGLFLGAAAIGGFAGWKSVENIEPEQAAEAATVGRPPDQPKPATAEPVVVPSAAERTRVDRRPSAVPATPLRTRQRTTAEPGAEVAADSIAEDIQVVQGSAPAVEDTASVQQAAADSATMALPNRTIARTLSRIGYACGEVASTTAVDAGAGVFKVTCTSGNSYRAAPVRGRYHFRRWSGR